MYAEKECSNRRTTSFLLQLLTITTFEKDSTFVFDADKRKSLTAVLIIPLPSAEGELKLKVSFLNLYLLISNQNISYTASKQLYYLLMSAQFSASWPFGLPEAQF